MASPKKNPNLKIASSTLICADSELIGPITIGPRTIIHPRVKIIAEAGPITIGEGNLIEEQSIICNRRRAEDNPETGERMMSIGDNNVFEASSTCEALKIGDNNVLEPKSYVGPSVELTNGCIVGAGCRLVAREALVENTVIYGSDHLRRIQIERPAPQTLQLDFLTKILPNYHHLLRSSKPKI